MKTKHVISVSGGKDSTATLLLAIDRVGRENLVPIFCDTGNEHAAVYEYLDYLELALEIKIVRLKADFSEQIVNKRMFIARDQRTRRDKKTGRRVRWTNKANRRALAVLHPTGNPFLDLALWKGRFPSRKGQFCTEELKRNMAVAYQLDLVDAGYRVISWQGVRRDESENRRNAKQAERIGPRMYAFRPLVEWTALDVFDYCAKHSIQPNPLYLSGCNRVGCMPCINVSKDELRTISQRWPHEIERIAEWERMVAKASKQGAASFFYDSDVERARRGGSVLARVEWSRTTRGGTQYDLLADIEEPTACASAYGLCG